MWILPLSVVLYDTVVCQDGNQAAEFLELQQALILPVMKTSVPLRTNRVAVRIK